MNENQILSSLKKGDEQAFRVIFEKYSPYVYNVSIKYLNSRAESEEIVQEVFFKVWLYRSRIKEELPFAPYLISIAKNLIFNRSKHQLVAQAYVQYLQYQPKQCPLTTENSIQFQEIKKITDDYVETLPEVRKQVFKLSKVESFSNKEIAQKLSVSERTVENHIYRALKALRLHLQSFGYAELILFWSVFI